MGVLRFLAILLATLGVLASSATAQTRAWPARPLKLIIPATAGSSLDVLGRILADRLRDRLGQPVIIEIRPGGSGNIGIDAVAKSPPDGYTMGMGYNGPLAFAPFLYSKLPYDPQRDLAPVVITSAQPNVLAVNAQLPVNSVKELIAYAKSNPGKLNYASVGAGSSSHLTMELFAQMVGFEATHVPYTGGPGAALSLAQGETQMAFVVAAGIMPQVNAGRVKLLAVTTRERFPSLPDLPTIAESGVPGFDVTAWNGIVMPAGTPADIIQRLNAEFDEILHARDIRARLDAVGMAPVGGSPEALRALMRSEAERWGPIIRTTGAKID